MNGEMKQILLSSLFWRLDLDVTHRALSTPHPFTRQMIKFNRVCHPATCPEGNILRLERANSLVVYAESMSKSR